MIRNYSMINKIINWFWLAVVPKVVPKVEPKVVMTCKEEKALIRKIDYRLVRPTHAIYDLVCERWKQPDAPKATTNGAIHVPICLYKWNGQPDVIRWSFELTLEAAIELVRMGLTTDNLNNRATAAPRDDDDGGWSMVGLPVKELLQTFPPHKRSVAKGMQSVFED